MTDISAVVAAIRRADRRTCARLITRIEAGDVTADPILQALYTGSAGTAVIGITGPPGVGKSTLIDELTAEYRHRQLTVAVLAIDPSSPFSGGAILGDRVRMARHNTDQGVFIRSMSARGCLGGLARAAGDALIVLEAMHPDVILVETVGVGQNETDIMQYARTVVVLQPPAGGDSVQAIKAGTLEIGDVLVVTKADLSGADRMMSVLRESVELRSDDEDHWRPAILKVQARSSEGITQLVEAIDRHGEFLRLHPTELQRRLRRQARVRLFELVSDLLRRRYEQGREQGDRFETAIDDVVARRHAPHSAAAALVESLSGEHGPG